jgi:hypothetical protein
MWYFEEIVVCYLAVQHRNYNYLENDFSDPNCIVILCTGNEPKEYLAAQNILNVAGFDQRPPD